MSLLLLHIIDASISEQIKSLLFGNVLIFIISISALFNLGIGLWSAAKVLRQLFIRMRANGKVNDENVVNKIEIFENENSAEKNEIFQFQKQVNSLF